MIQTASARDLFRAAYENRYTWDEKFPGYSADLCLKQGNEIYTGKIQINQDFSTEITGIENPEVEKSIANQLRDVITHRKRATFEQSHGKNTFNIGNKDENDAIEILVTGDAMGSNYKIRGKEICQVSRVIGQMAFVIDTHESLNTEEGYLSKRYDAIFHNSESGEIIKTLKFEDTYTKIGKYYVMSKQVIWGEDQGQPIITEFNFSNIEMLDRVVE